MGRHHDHGVESTAAIAGHPIHPMLVPFPIAFLVGALVTDLVFLWQGDPFWARASFWLIAAGLAMGAVAALAGLTDFATIRTARDHATGWLHFGGNAIVLAVAALNLWLRWADAVAPVASWGVWLSLIAAGLLGVTGWLGGELAYRHRIGMIADARHGPLPTTVRTDTVVTPSPANPADTVQRRRG